MFHINYKYNENATPRYHFKKYLVRRQFSDNRRENGQGFLIIKQEVKVNRDGSIWEKRQREKGTQQPNGFDVKCLHCIRKKGIPPVI